MGKRMYQNARTSGRRIGMGFSGRKPREGRSWTWLVFMLVGVITGHVCFAQSAIVAATDPQDLQVLTNIQQRYSSWSALWPASAGPDPCTGWRGVICDNQGGQSRVVNLSIVQQQGDLSGPIPRELGNLASLTYLELQVNNLSGPIPPELGNLAKLTDLYVSSKSLTGPIPPELGNLSSLKRLGLFFSSLSGPIPRELGNLSNLTEIALAANNLSGPIPPELGNLSSLTFLTVASNNLSGPIPPELGNLSSLTHRLDLSSNSFSGHIPRELGKLAKNNISIIDLSSNFLMGNVPPEFLNSSILLNFSAPLLYLNCFNETADNLYQPGQRDPTACAAYYPELARNCTPPYVAAAESSEGCVKVVRFVASFTCMVSKMKSCKYSLNIEDILRQLAMQLTPPNIDSCCRPKQLVAVNLDDDGRQNFTLIFNVVPLGVTEFSDDVLRGINRSAEAILQKKSIIVGDNFKDGPETLVEQPQHFPPPPLAPALVTYEPPGSKSPPPSPLGAAGIVGISLGSLSFIVAVISLVVWRRWRMQSVGGKREEPHFFRAFTLQELRAATDNFAEGNRLGRGGFGEVFRGVITDDTQPSGTRVVAIKRAAASEGRRGDTVQAQQTAAEQLVQEFKLLATVYHRYLLRSLGYCIEGNESLFVSEFMPNGSLGDVLKSPTTRKLLSWERRRDIVQGTANALNYLHSSCRPPILHNDIKPANVLLDEGWEPRLADFGLARETGCPVVDRHNLQGAADDGSVTVGGATKGYAAPEILRGGRATPKSDVFSFGRLVLVVLSSNSPFPGMKHEVLRLCHEGRGQAFLDPEMSGLDQNGDQKEALRFLLVALLCMHEDPARRPTMGEVCNMLQGVAAVPEPPPWGLWEATIRPLDLKASSTTPFDSSQATSDNASNSLDPRTLDISLKETVVFSAHIPPR